MQNAPLVSGAINLALQSTLGDMRSQQTIFILEADAPDCEDKSRASGWSSLQATARRFHYFPDRQPETQDLTSQSCFKYFNRELSTCVKFLKII